jgi:hypothetical protein
MMQRDSLQPRLEEAQRALDTALEEACGVDVRRANTGEMIRIEETLAIATNAAKEVVSVRLRRRTRETKAPRPEIQRLSERGIDRVFDDTRGKRWHAYAVHPSAGALQGAALREEFRQGWLCFESHDQLRRFTPIPLNWEDLAVEDLRQLCQKAERAAKRH